MEVYNINKITHQEFIDRISKISPNILITTQYTNSDAKVRCICKDCGYEWDAIPYNLSAGKNCKMCYFKRSSEKKMMPPDVFVEKLKERNIDVQLVGEYKGMCRKTDFKCLIHGETFSMTPTHLLGGETGCQKCLYIKTHDNRIKTHDQYVEDLRKINKYITVIGRYDGAKNPIEVQCNVCGEIWNPEASSLLCGCGCPHCARSRGERMIKQYLEDHHIRFIQQKKFSDLRGDSSRPLPLSYDFYLPTYNLLIEFQGRFHDGTALYVEQDLYFGNQQNRDKKKKKYAEDKGYHFLEIWYYDMKNLNNILDEYLQKLENPVTTTAI